MSGERRPRTSGYHPLWGLDGVRHSMGVSARWSGIL